MPELASPQLADIFTEVQIKEDIPEELPLSVGVIATVDPETLRSALDDTFTYRQGAQVALGRQEQAFVQASRSYSHVYMALGIKRPASLDHIGLPPECEPVIDLKDYPGLDGAASTMAKAYCDLSTATCQLESSVNLVELGDEVHIKIRSLSRPRRLATAIAGALLGAGIGLGLSHIAFSNNPDVSSDTEVTARPDGNSGDAVMNGVLMVIGGLGGNNRRNPPGI